jgi:hypothetical protein
MANNITPAEFEAAIRARMGDDPLGFLLHNVVEEFTPEELATNETVRLIVLVGRELLIELGRPEEFADYIIAKNIKISGGINQYINHFFAESPAVGMDPIDYALSLPFGERRAGIIDSTIIVLSKMLIQPGLTAENRARIEASINRLNPPLPGAAAPAAGGGLHRARHRRSRRRRSTRHRRRR